MELEQRREGLVIATHEFDYSRLDEAQRVRVDVLEDQIKSVAVDGVPRSGVTAAWPS